MKHWVFDFDGTLVDSEGYFSRCINYALEPFHKTMAPDFIESIRHRHPDQIFDGLLETHQIQTAFRRLKEMGESVAQEIKVFEGIVDVLKALDRKQNTVAIWTGRDRLSTELILKNIGLDGAFEKIVTGTCVEQNKPQQDGLIVIKNYYKARPQDMVMVGDHHHDIEPANQLGCLSIHAKWKRNPHVLPDPIKPSREFYSAFDLLTWIKS